MGGGVGGRREGNREKKREKETEKIWWGIKIWQFGGLLEQLPNLKLLMGVKARLGP